ncbi:response regulator [Paenisporosarcina antarctica]|uniref:Transcriptional regulatory protein n=1 Tax=Paenisporosarcina antarctica TaxID=417367 RepID=A0A4P7A0U0_9BACL|nr:response regulator [Paenisporosarcina antarctica]QBP42218.1 response regulator [Paenisporosarcina antarctica]
MTKIIEVLIVEDDIRIAEIHRRFINKIEGFIVVGSANTGAEAKDWISALKPDLILLDVYLPDMMGTELMIFIQEESPDSDIIYITAASEVNIVKQAFRGGVVDYILKPLTFDRFQDSLRSYKEIRTTLSKPGNLEEESIHLLWNHQKSISSPDSFYMPKGIDPITMEKVIIQLRQQTNGITAEKLGIGSGVSRSTARRYLEFLVSESQARAELIYGTIGRPERRYFPKNS